MDKTEAHRIRELVTTTALNGMLEMSNAAGLVPLVGVTILLDVGGGLAVHLASDKALQAKDGDGQALVVEIREAISRFLKTLPDMEVLPPEGTS